MPLMRALFDRCGQPIPMRVDKFDYLFTEDASGNFVANVANEEHIDYLLGTKNFEMYDPKENAKKSSKKVSKKSSQQPESGVGDESRIDF